MVRPRHEITIPCRGVVSDLTDSGVVFIVGDLPSSVEIFSVRELGDPLDPGLQLEIAIRGVASDLELCG